MTLPVPHLVDRDPVAITREMVAAYEASTGRPLQPAQLEHLLIDVFAYRETLVRITIQEAVLQNLVAFAHYPMLDHLGELVGTPRLDARPAVTVLRFTLVSAQPIPVVVPAGTRVQASNAAVVFSTDAELVIAAGVLHGGARATAEADGIVGNGYANGTITELMAPVPFVASAGNVVPTDGGAEVEDDERYRERVRQAPERFSTAGSAASYRFHALSVSSAINDVRVANPLSGVVRLYVLADTGLPSAALLAEVYDAVSGEKVRPLSDSVEVVAPAAVPYQITATVYPVEGADPASVMAGARRAAEGYAARLRSSLGRDIVPSQIIAALGSVAGVHDVVLSSPAARELHDGEWANAVAITLTQGPAARG